MKVEVTNKALENTLTKLIDGIDKDWVKILVEATWAYNTTWKTTTSFTLYQLVYGKKDLLLAYFEYHTLTMASQLNIDLTKEQIEWI